MSGAMEKLSAEEEALFKQMEADDAALPPEPVRERPATAAPDPAPEAEPEPATDKPAPPEAKLIDKRALDEERGRRKAAEKELAKTREFAAAEQAKVNTRLEMLMAAVEANAQPAAVAPQPPPAFDTDPKAWIEHNIKTLDQKQADIDRKLAEIQNSTSRLTAQQQERLETAQLQQWVQSQEREYAANVPDYDAAMKHLIGIRVEQLRAMRFDDAQIGATVHNDIRAMSMDARQRGMNPGEVFYNVAKASGFTGAAPAAAAAAAPASAAESAAERLIRGQDMATTIGSTGAAARGEVAATAIASMSDAEFNTLYNKVKNDKAAMLRLFGS